MNTSVKSQKQKLLMKQFTIYKPKHLETMDKKRLTKKHYAVILTALELSLADRTDEMQCLISEIQDIIEPRTTDNLIKKWNVSSHT